MNSMNYTQWNAFDWALALMVLVSMVVAFRSGLVRAALGLMGLIAGFQLASWWYVPVGDLISPARLSWPQPARRIFGFLAIVVVVSVLMQLAGWALQKVLRKVGLGGFDRVLGAAFGFARGCVLAIAVLMAASVAAPQSELLTTSVLTPYLFAVAHDVSFLVPQYLLQQMMDGAFDFKHNPPGWIKPS